MRMNDIMRTRGIEITEEKDFGRMNHPAREGETRWGRIRKEMKISSPSDWGSSKKSLLGIEIDTWEKTIEVRCLDGAMPLAPNLFYALLADRDVRRLILEYQESGRDKAYQIWSKIGMSGAQNVFLAEGRKVGGFTVTNTVKLCHISCYGRLNEGFGNKESKMKIGDFVELAVYLGFTEDMKVKSLRKKAGVKYVLPKFAEELQNFNTEVSKIL